METDEQWHAKVDEVNAELEAYRLAHRQDNDIFAEEVGNMTPAELTDNWAVGWQGNLRLLLSDALESEDIEAVIRYCEGASARSGR